MIQWGLILPWTACHTWSTGSLCGPSVATCGAAACQGGRKPCHTLCTDKSSLNGNCVRVSWPGIADHRTVELIQKGDLCGKTVSEILSKKEKKEKRILICSGFKISSSNSWYLSDTFYNRNCFCLLWDCPSLLKAFHVLRFFLQKNINDGSLWNPSTRKKYSVCNRSHRWGFKPVQHLTWIKSGKRFLQVGQVK